MDAGEKEDGEGRERKRKRERKKKGEVKLVNFLGGQLCWQLFRKNPAQNHPSENKAWPGAADPAGNWNR